jgi:23S rRNA (guanosine2251-2'-O)-methyltransferase
MKKPAGEQPPDRNRGNRGIKARLENAHTNRLSPESTRADIRIPFRATAAAAPYQAIRPLPVSVLLENVRSLYNVGAFFRTADAAGIEKLYLAGFTGSPPDRMISKTALGAEESVAWERAVEPAQTLAGLRQAGYEIAAIETSVHAVDLFDWQPRFPVCVVFGHETDGLSPAVAEFADTHVRIPMLGVKHSLNVATAAGVVLYELLRKYRDLHRASI